MKTLFASLFIIFTLATACQTKEIVKTVKVINTEAAEIKAQTFSVKSSLAYLKEVARASDCVIKNEAFLKEIGSHKQFDYTKLSSADVEKQLRTYKPIVLSSYRKVFSKSIAYRNTGSNVVYFNTAKNPRPMKQMVNTAFHEWSHVQGFGHGDNYLKGKSNSVPYGGGDIAEKYVDECKL